MKNWSRILIPPHLESLVISKVVITLIDDKYTEEPRETQVETEESIPEGFQNLDKWEQDVHQIGFRSMRKLFKSGIEFFDEKVLSGYM